MTKPTSGIAWLTERVTLLAQLHDKSLGMIEAQAQILDKVADQFEAHREHLTELDKKCDHLHNSVDALCKAVGVLGGMK
jgi:hypothetical protein